MANIRDDNEFCLQHATSSDSIRLFQLHLMLWTGSRNQFLSLLSRTTLEANFMHFQIVCECTFAVVLLRRCYKLAFRSKIVLFSCDHNVYGAIFLHHFFILKVSNMISNAQTNLLGDVICHDHKH